MTRAKNIMIGRVRKYVAAGAKNAQARIFPGDTTTRIF